ncbi:MAG: cysteine desulfurase [Vampirovibrio sp.]|nr:cysteine desulfurase [Vampirovibrio sp.]
MTETDYPTSESFSRAFDPEVVRRDFPVLQQQVHGKPLVYLDNAATTQKPQAVIEGIRKFYAEDYGTVRRGVYELSARSTRMYEDAREKVASFLNAPNSQEVIFVRGTTEAINLVAFGYGRAFLKPGDEVIISAIEHHANIVPWQLACEATGATLKVIPCDDRGALIMAEYEKLLSSNTQLVAVNHVSNALGTVNPVKEIIDKAHAVGAVVLIDGAQSAPHMPVDVQALGCDFYTFSGHKIYAPTGIGVLYGKMDLLEKMAPFQSGGEMIETVTFEKTTFAKPPNKYEGGTPAIAQAIGLGYALDYVTGIGLDAIAAYEQELLEYATQRLLHDVPGLTIIGTAPEKAGLISFTLADAHPLDIGTLIDHEGIAIRTGHHCAQPVMKRFNVPATARASFAFYNTKEEVDKLVAGLHKVIEMVS